MSEFDALIGPLLQREGGYVDHKDDRGGATNYGITQRVYSDWSGISGRDVRAMQKGEAVKIYFDLYWKPAKCEQLPEQIREIHFDSAVNHGVGRAVKLLQSALGVTVDGVIGGKTIGAADAMDYALLKARYTVERYKFYGGIVARDKSQLVFIVGWMNRMLEFT